MDKVARQVYRKSVNHSKVMNPSQYFFNAKKIVCIGRNYADHIAELGNQRPTKPFFFLKPSSSIVRPKYMGEEQIKKHSPVLIPHGMNVHYEVELAVIMGQNCRDNAFRSKNKAEMDVLKAENPNFREFWDYAIWGYAIGIDLTARNLQDEVKKQGLPWSAAKGYDTFMPLSTFIPKEKIPDPHDVRLQLQVNGKVVQDDNTNLMLFKIPELFDAITDVMTLEKGDIVLTGTPKGVGQVVHGDVMKASCFVGDELIESFEIACEDRKHFDGTPW